MGLILIPFPHITYYIPFTKHWWNVGWIYPESNLFILGFQKVAPATRPPADF